MYCTVNEWVPPTTLRMKWSWRFRKEQSKTVKTKFANTEIGVPGKSKGTRLPSCVRVNRRRPLQEPERGQVEQNVAPKKTSRLCRDV